MGLKCSLDPVFQWELISKLEDGILFMSVPGASMLPE